MAKKTLLDIVQNILSAMDSDEVNSIGDTVESLQVAEVVRETYEDITVGIEIPGRAGIIKLDASGDINSPNKMKLPSNAERLEWVRYNNKDIEYVTPKVFVERTSNREDEDTVVVVDGMYIYDDRDPTFYTSFDDEHLFFDAFNSDEGSTLMQSKTFCWGQRELAFEMQDDFIPPLPVEMFPRLLSEAKAVCFVNFKQVANAKEEQRARRQRVTNQNSRHKAGKARPIDRLPNYGKPPR